MSNVLSTTAAPANTPAPANAAGPSRDAARMGPVWVLIAVFLAMALWGAMAFQRRAEPGGTIALPASPTAVYVGLILMEWGLVWYVWKAGLGGSVRSLGALVGGRWGSARDVVVDVVIGLATWTMFGLASSAWVAWLGAGSAASVQSLLPRRPHEIALWILLSMSAGFGEELVFRGYLQERFRVLTGSAWLAVLLQAALFGVSHGYQGVDPCLRITVYGLLFGVVAGWRRSLRPGIIAHAWTDIASGILRF
jgi:membrane protease YdiL (CAAX protease family)